MLHIRQHDNGRVIIRARQYHWGAWLFLFWREYYQARFIKDGGQRNLWGQIIRTPTNCHSDTERNGVERRGRISFYEMKSIEQHLIHACYSICTLPIWKLMKNEMLRVRSAWQWEAELECWLYDKDAQLVLFRWEYSPTRVTICT
jgi:hypothetical protein